MDWGHLQVLYTCSGLRRGHLDIILQNSSGLTCGHDLYYTYKTVDSTQIPRTLISLANILTLHCIPIFLLSCRCWRRRRWGGGRSHTCTRQVFFLFCHFLFAFSCSRVYFVGGEKEVEALHTETDQLPLGNTEQGYQLERGSVNHEILIVVLLEGLSVW